MPYLLLLKSLNPKAIAIALAAFALFSAGWYFNGLRWEHKLAGELAAQEAKLVGECKDLQAVTKGANDDLQRNFDIIKRKLASRVQQSRCIVPSSGASNVAGVERESTRPHGISTGWLREYAADCEAIRQTFISCDKFTKAERAPK